METSLGWEGESSFEFPRGEGQLAQRREGAHMPYTPIEAPTLPMWDIPFPSSQTKTPGRNRPHKIPRQLRPLCHPRLSSAHHSAPSAHARTRRAAPGRG